MLKFASNRKGLTLLELLLACSMIIFIGVDIYKTFCSGIAMYDWLARNRPQNDVVIFLEKVALDLRNYAPVEGKRFIATKNNISFYVHDTDYVLFPEKDIAEMDVNVEIPLYRVEYTFHGDKQNIQRKVYKFGSNRSSRSMIVLAGIAAMSFEYCVLEGSNINYGKFYPFADKEPVAVKIEVAMSGDSGQYGKSERIIEMPYLLSR